MFRIVPERNITLVFSSEAKYADRSRSKDRVALSAANHFDTSDPSGSRPGQGQQKSGEVVNFSATIHRTTPTGRCTSSSTAPLDQVGRAVVKVTIKKLQEAAASLGWNLGFHICKDQVWFVAHCQGVEQEVSLVLLRVPRDHNG